MIIHKPYIKLQEESERKTKKTVISGTTKAECRITVVLRGSRKMAVFPADMRSTASVIQRRHFDGLLARKATSSKDVLDFIFRANLNLPHVGNAWRAG